uniref:ATP synthase complex subunit 8 n=1 Tax=Coccidophilus cariba TaxID=2743657 RepID=A0A6N0GXP9_9CUCU|nr:ATP synthase F0 subunit 8 [Coccidophilus cariba]
MPQMAPLNWLTLFFYFIMMYFILNSCMYFSHYYIKSIKIFSKNFKMNSNIWKW